MRSRNPDAIADAASRVADKASTAHYIATMTDGMARQALRAGLDPLGHILRMAAMEAANQASAAIKKVG